ncbi:MAG: tRNA (adenosine(37)-N6)-threonylcarbamoyltransferase complex dimerization subunit type 1 TsaB [Bacteroidota bacterium]|jgi:tRNA threonylcarbamoyladenosine biosynthesis protein TsaB|nr:tRNA (adenosine(37)-N6)-threonylcarbamoyltransferase complex dimerization subunit type 1 TsaB [Bacteroidota bacterium]
MEYILNIHTSIETAIVNICNGQNVIDTVINKDPKQHSAFLHTAIQNLLLKNKILANDLKAIGVTSGPGSYTGIRVGLATAKGLCYSLKTPLLTFNTLEVMAFSAGKTIGNKNSLYCPMIDARRTEVFTAVYTHDMREITPPMALILKEDSFADLIQLNSICFFGSGSKKFENIINKTDASIFADIEITSEALARFGYIKYQKREFTDIIFAEPLYVKEFYSPLKK